MASALERLVERLPDARQYGHGYRAKCPRHDGKHRDSLSLSEGEDGAALVYCFGGCETADVLRSIGLEMKDLYPESHPGARGQRPKAGWSWKGKQKDKLAVEAEKLAIQFAALIVVKLLYPIDGKPLDLSDLESEAVAPYNTLLADLWTVYRAHQQHEDVQAAWLRLVPELAQSAPNLVAAVDRQTQVYLRSFSAQAGDHTPLVRGKKAADLLRQTFDPPKEIIPGVLFEGLTILVGKPKVGKSRLLLAMAVAIASGGKVLGSIPVEAGAVLYISLEDHERRLQKRINALLGPDPCPDTLEYEREWRRLDEGGLEDLELWLARHPQAKLIVIDTFKRIRSQKRRNGSAYDDDYDALQGLQDLANRHPGLGLIVNHHENKMGAVDDWMDRASGSTGLTGAVDGAASLRRQRGAADAVLTITHRDIETDEGQYEYALKSDHDTGGWSLLGDAAKYQMSQQQQAIYAVLEQASTPMSPKMIALALGKTDEKGIAVIYVQLNRMLTDGKVTSPTHGKYALPDPSIPPSPACASTHIHTVKVVKDVKDDTDVQVVQVAPEPLPPTSTTLISPLELVKVVEPAAVKTSVANLNNLNTRTPNEAFTCGTCGGHRGERQPSGRLICLDCLGVREAEASYGG
jgi:Fe2+ or Zn2+ uptake regulation protein